MLLPRGFDVIGAEALASAYGGADLRLRPFEDRIPKERLAQSPSGSIKRMLGRLSGDIQPRKAFQHGPLGGHCGRQARAQTDEQLRCFEHRRDAFLQIGV